MALRGLASRTAASLRGTRQAAPRAAAAVRAVGGAGGPSAPVSAHKPASTAAFSSEAFKLPDLQYDYHELEPFVSAEIMELHHSKHHNTYVTNLNNVMDATLDAQARGDVAAVVALQPALRFNGGGHINHSIFWENLAPPSKGGGGEPEGELKKYIDKAFGDFEVRRPARRGRCSASTTSLTRLCSLLGAAVLQEELQRADSSRAGQRVGLARVQQRRGPRRVPCHAEPGPTVLDGADAAAWH